MAFVTDDPSAPTPADCSPGSCDRTETDLARSPGGGSLPTTGWEVLGTLLLAALLLAGGVVLLARRRRDAR